MLNTILITGATSGIGQAIARELATADSQIIITSRHRDKKALDTLSILPKHAKTIHYCIDNKDPQTIRQEVRKMQDQLGPIDIFIHNAGITNDALISKMESSQWNDVIETNLSSAFHYTQSIVPQMIRRRKGKIVFISSIVAKTGNIGQANYASAKAGLLGLTKSLAIELAEHNIAVNAICPGFINTPMLTKVPINIQEKIKKKIPIHRFGTSEEVAQLVSYLVSQQTGYLTGSIIDISGGLH